MESIIFHTPHTFDANRFLSQSSIRAKFFPDKEDNGALGNFEEKYNPKVLEGNWFERRLPSPPTFKNDWKTIYKADYEHHANDLFRSQRTLAWDNKLDFEVITEPLSTNSESPSGVYCTCDLSLKEMSVDGLREDDPTCRWQSTYQLGYNHIHYKYKM